MKKVALFVAAAALAVMMTGCSCKEAKADLGKAGSSSFWTSKLTFWKSVTVACKESYRPGKPCCPRRVDCPACGRITPHYGICPNVVLFDK